MYVQGILDTHGEWPHFMCFHITNSVESHSRKYSNQCQVVINHVPAPAVQAQDNRIPSSGETPTIRKGRAEEIHSLHISLKCGIVKSLMRYGAVLQKSICSDSK